jgi:hypothetical protein
MAEPKASPGPVPLDLTPAAFGAPKSAQNGGPGALAPCNAPGGGGPDPRTFAQTPVNGLLKTRQMAFLRGLPPEPPSPPNPDFPVFGPAGADQGPAGPGRKAGDAPQQGAA